MTPDEDLFTTLNDYAGLQALIGNGDSPETYRVYPVIAPQDVTRPFVVYQRITGSRINTMADAGGTGVQRIVYQVRSWSTSHKNAFAISEQIRLAMKNATLFTTVPLTNFDSYDKDFRLYSYSYDFSVWYR